MIRIRKHRHDHIKILIITFSCQNFFEGLLYYLIDSWVGLEVSRINHMVNWDK